MNLSPHLNLALRAARQAGDLIQQAQRNLSHIEVEKKRSNDFVTAVDRAAEEVIVSTLSRAYPDHVFWGEEGGTSRGGVKVSFEEAQRATFLWLIDPLDGTTNFVHGLPHYAVSIALLTNGKVTDAVIFDPSRNELFVAARGRGAFLDQQRLRVSNRSRLEEALIATGFLFRDQASFNSEFNRIRGMAQSCVGLRRAGAAALDLAYVASARLDGFFEQHLHPWDVAAGALLVQEAGGYVGDFAGGSNYLYGGEMVAASPRLFAAMVQKIQAS